MDDALRPCPFCGGEAEWKSGGPGCAWVTCKDCPAETGDGSIPRIVAAWNRRAPVTPLQAALSVPEVRGLVEFYGREEFYHSYEGEDSTITCDGGQKARAILAKLEAKT